MPALCSPSSASHLFCFFLSISFTFLLPLDSPISQTGRGNVEMAQLNALLTRMERSEADLQMRYPRAFGLFSAVQNSFNVSCQSAKPSFLLRSVCPFFLLYSSLHLSLNYLILYLVPPHPSLHPYFPLSCSVHPSILLPLAPSFPPSIFFFLCLPPS